MNTSNWINLGILAMTGLVGLLSWLGSHNAAREAREDQKAANAAADRSALAAEEANKIQTRMVEIEDQRHKKEALDAKKASLVARIDWEQRLQSSGSMYDSTHLVIANQGLAEARNLQISIEGQSVDDHPRVLTRQPVSEMLIGPSAEIKFILSVTLDWAPPFDCEISWDDNSGERGYWKSTLT